MRDEIELAGERQYLSFFGIKKRQTFLENKVLGKLASGKERGVSDR